MKQKVQRTFSKPVMAEKSKGLGPAPPASGNGKGIPPAPAGKGNPPGAACGACDSPEDVSDLEVFSSLGTVFASVRNIKST